MEFCDIQIIDDKVEITFCGENAEDVMTIKISKDDAEQIKQAIEEIFQVEVLSVNTVIRPSKRKRVGKKRKMKLYSARKKALVKLKEGQTIDLFDLGGEN